MTVDYEKRPIPADGLETPAEFLSALGKTLRENEQIDPDLAEILSGHLLTGTPANDAVMKARNAIVKLAEERAVPKEGAGGE
jgi:hypothetical protein